MSRPVHVVIDSTASIPPELRRALPLTVVPNMLNWQGVSLRDEIDISPSEFYTRLKTDPELPTTSQAPPAAFGETFDSLLEQGRQVLAILLSSKISGTYQSALLAQADRPGEPITLIDSLSSGMGSGWAAVLAARAAQAGADLPACLDLARRALANSGVLGTVNTLEFLHRTGRIGGARRFLGSALDLKPILELRDGEIQGVDRVRTRTRALQRLLDLVEERIGGREPVRLAIMHANDPETAALLVERVQTRFRPVETVTSEFSPILGVNFGEGTVGVCYLAGME